MPGYIRTVGGGNPAVLSSLSPVAVPLWADPDTDVPAAMRILMAANNPAVFNSLTPLAVPLLNQPQDFPEFSQTEGSSS